MVGTKSVKPTRHLALSLLTLFITLGCQTTGGSRGSSNETPEHWYHSVEGGFSVRTPTSLTYQVDHVTIKHGDQSYRIDLSVHRGDLSPWFFEILHAPKPAFWGELNSAEQSWWLRASAQARYQPFRLIAVKDDRLLGEQDGRHVDVRIAESPTRLYWIAAGVPPGTLDDPAVASFFNSFRTIEARP